MPNAKRKILIVDDEEDNLNYLSQILQPNYIVLTATNGMDCVDLARSELPDLILMDIQMPKLSGFEACKLIRNNEATKHITIVMISGYEDQEKQIKGFSYGADDFVEKPYKLKDLLARIDSKIRRVNEQTEDTPVISCGNLTLEPLKLEARICGNKIELSALEFKLLKFFAEHPEQVLNRDRILNTVWADVVAITKRTIDTHLVGLRKKLVGFNYEFTSVYGEGYKLEEKRAKAA